MGQEKNCNVLLFFCKHTDTVQLTRNTLNDDKDVRCKRKIDWGIYF